MPREVCMLLRYECHREQLFSSPNMQSIQSAWNTADLILKTTGLEKYRSGSRCKGVSRSQKLRK